MIIKGLDKAGYGQDAYNATYKTLYGMQQVFNKTGTVWENYKPDAFEPGSTAAKDFVGWTGLTPIALLIENLIGIVPNGAKNSVTWTLRRTDQHGIKTLHFGNTTASLIYLPGDAKSSPKIAVETDKPLTLVIVRNGTQTQYAVKKGKSQINL
jgi:hypothetical protein